ncbi:FMN-binding negative transcriptional regulator [Rossellomorea vietnamensis]|uniref:FMN-binding negative transcriptional regulator n=1 Tax=Rossellomorea vietnamensis TaxID=218284 RepID=A0A5D4MD98_9BACI|nr:FMN-binding negative transcriptional regulator [Rossellomorea vietnamensis]TYR99313.1 FMN-binding negative transcriptional regulator [Rossellomorea vietnamensis]
MFIPKEFKVENQDQLLKFIQENSFGILFSQDEEGPKATHLPFILIKDEEPELIGHLAKANPQWKTLKGKKALVVFSGPHSYISASWYKESRNVPTWNYVAVHVEGTVEILEEADALLSILHQSVQYYEKDFEEPWKMEDEPETVKRLLNGIIGFRIKIEKLEGKWKLNQNKSKENKEKVIENLRKQKIYDSHEIADLMERE